MFCNNRRFSIIRRRNQNQNNYIVEDLKREYSVIGVYNFMDTEDRWVIEGEDKVDYLAELDKWKSCVETMLGCYGVKRINWGNSEENSYNSKQQDLRVL